MHFTKAFAILSLAAVTIAAPSNTVVMRNDIPDTSCAQDSTASCCDSEATMQPAESALKNSPVGLVALALGLIPNFLSTVSLNAKCNALVGVTACASTPVCCINDPSGTTTTTDNSLVSLLNNDNVSICPAVGV